MKKKFCRLLFFALPFLWNGIYSDIYISDFESALKIARVNNKEFELGEKFSAGQVKLAKKDIGAFLPAFDFSWAEAADVEPSVQDSKVKKIEAGVTQKVYDGGKSMLEYKMQKTGAELDFLDFKKEMEDFECTLLSSYYTALLDRIKIRVKEAALLNARRILEIALLEFEQKMITESDLLETGIAVKKIENEVKALYEESRKSSLLLADLMGVKITEKIFLSEEESLLDENDFNGISWTEESERILGQKAIQKSLDLKRLNFEIDFARKKRSLQKRVFLPSVSLNGSVGFSGRNYPLTRPSWTFKVIVGFENNPWLPGKIASAWDFKRERLSGQANSADFNGIINTTFFDTVRQSKIELEQKCLSRDKLLVQIQNEVTEALESIKMLQENAALGLETLRLMERKLLFSEIRVREGLITKNDFIEEENEIAEQKIQNAQNRGQLLYLEKKLKIMTGEWGGIL